MLLKPSTAENLIDLQAEFNALSLNPEKEAHDDEMDGAHAQPDQAWSLQRYYQQWAKLIN